MANATNPYGDGRAAVRIRQILRVHFGLSDRLPEPFDPALPLLGEPAAREVR
jgi:hypothetical protein